MKQLLIICILLCGYLSSIANNFGELCENIPNVNCISINQKMLKLASFPTEASNSNIDLDDVADKLENIEILNCEHKETIPVVKSTVKKYLSKEPRFERTMRMTDGEDTISMYMKELPDNRYEYILVLAESDEITVINLVGSVTPQQLGDCTNF